MATTSSRADAHALRRGADVTREGYDEDRPRARGERIAIEPRWPVALVVLCFIIITITLRVFEPQRESLGPPWFVPAVEIAMLVALIAADPARVSGRRKWLRRASITLVFALAVVATVSTVVLIETLIGGGKLTGSPSSLLASGALIWLGNLLVFSLLYWQLDTGGPRARHQRERLYPDFAFPQQLNPELAPPGWRPQYVDYFMLGLTTSTALSPTDVMPMAHWAKLAMAPAIPDLADGDRTRHRPSRERFLARTGDSPFYAIRVIRPMVIRAISWSAGGGPSRSGRRRTRGTAPSLRRRCARRASLSSTRARPSRGRRPRGSRRRGRRW